MPRFVPYFVLLVAISLPAVLLARTFMSSEGSQIEGLIAGVEDERLAAWLDSTATEGGLVVSTRDGTQRFFSSQRSEARALLEEMTGIDGAEEVRVRQQQVTLGESQATVVVNLQVGDDAYVALRLSLRRVDEGWSIDRIRLMS